MSVIDLPDYYEVPSCGRPELSESCNRPMKRVEVCGMPEQACGFKPKKMASPCELPCERKPVSPCEKPKKTCPSPCGKPKKEEPIIPTKTSWWVWTFIIIVLIIALAALGMAIADWFAAPVNTTKIENGSITISKLDPLMMSVAPVPGTLVLRDSNALFGLGPAGSNGFSIVQNGKLVYSPDLNGIPNFKVKPFIPLLGGASYSSIVSSDDATYKPFFINPGPAAGSLFVNGTVIPGGNKFYGVDQNYPASGKVFGYLYIESGGGIKQSAIQEYTLNFGSTVVLFPSALVNSGFASSNYNAYAELLIATDPTKYYQIVGTGSAFTQINLIANGKYEFSASSFAGTDLFTLPPGLNTLFISFVAILNTNEGIAIQINEKSII